MAPTKYSRRSCHGFLNDGSMRMFSDHANTNLSIINIHTAINDSLSSSVGSIIHNHFEIFYFTPSKSLMWMEFLQWEYIITLHPNTNNCKKSYLKHEIFFGLIRRRIIQDIKMGSLSFKNKMISRFARCT